MRVLLSVNGSERPERFVKDLQYAGLPSHTHAIIYSTAEQPAVYSTLHHFEYEWPFPLTHDEIAVAGVETGRIARLVSEHFPQWFVEQDIPEDSHHIEVNDIARYHHVDLIIQESDGPHGLNPHIERDLLLVRQARSSVRFVRYVHPHADRALRILVTLDGSESSTSIIDAISMRAFPRNTQLYLLCVASDARQAYTPNVELFDSQNANERREQMLIYFSKHLENHFPLIEAHLVSGDPLTEILTFADQYQIDTIYAGSHIGRPEAITGVCDGIIQHARTNVEIVRWPARW